MKEVSCVATSPRNGCTDKNLNNENINRHTNMKGRKFDGVPALDKKAQAINKGWERELASPGDQSPGWLSKREESAMKTNEKNDSEGYVYIFVYIMHQ